ncbi:MAG TPA: N-acetyltransferase [Coriobacteriia bacterium]
MTIRPEGPADVAAVRRVELSAFETPAEADIVDALRGRSEPFLSLVAEVGGRIVGHILFTRMTLEPSREGLALGLAPLAVDREHQRAGVGSALARAGLDACREMGARLVFVLGDPDYYARFGFVPAAGLGFACRWDVPPGAFGVIVFGGWPTEVEPVLARYHSAFDAAV